MDYYPEPIENLITEFAKLPSIGKRSAERLALALAFESDENIDRFVDAIKSVKTDVHECSICGNLTDEDICSVCSDTTRDRKLLCLVESVKDLIAIEKSGEFRGNYFVLGGLISPMKDQEIDDRVIEKLKKRVEDGVEEVIIAISPTIEGEMTSIFIKEVLKDFDLVLTKIASGIPVGGNLEYFDGDTLFKALEDRRII